MQEPAGTPGAWGRPTRSGARRTMTASGRAGSGGSSSSASSISTMSSSGPVPACARAEGRRRGARVRRHDRPTRGPARARASRWRHRRAPIPGPRASRGSAARRRVGSSWPPGSAVAMRGEPDGSASHGDVTTLSRASREGVGVVDRGEACSAPAQVGEARPHGHQAAGSPRHGQALPGDPSIAGERQASTARAQRRPGRPEEVRPSARDGDLDRSLLDQLGSEEQLRERRGAGREAAPKRRCGLPQPRALVAHRRAPRRVSAMAATEPAEGVTPSWASRGRTISGWHRARSCRGHRPSSLKSSSSCRAIAAARSSRADRQ